MMDRSTQLDELESLKSIFYTEEFQVYHMDDLDPNEEIQAIFWAFCKLPDDYTVKYLNEPGSHECFCLKVKHLPPIELRLSFPLDYPSTNPPKFVISCNWLPKSKISLLCKKLDDLWSEYGAVEIVFTWCDFLKNDSLSFLGCEHGLDLRELCSMHLKFLKNLENSKILKETQPVNKEIESGHESSALKEKSENVSENESHVNQTCAPGTSMRGDGRGKVPSDTCTSSKRECPYSRKKSENNNNSKKKNGRLKKSHKKSKFDERAVLNLNIKTSPVRLLENYNAQREEVQFLRDFYTCNICFSDKVGKDCTKFSGCNHVFCINCIRSYFTVRILDGTVQSIKCPEDKCTTEALPSQVKEIVSEELFAKYDAVLLNTALDTLSDIIYCPRQLCQYPVSWNQDEKMASCPNCQYVFCVTCRMVYHGVEPCQFRSVEVKRLLSEYESGSKDVQSQLENKYGKKYLETLVNNSKAESWIQEHSKSCPKCEAPIEKSQGCNKMVCWKCNTYFCWLCGATLDVKNPYLHFNDPNSKCANKLFYLVPGIEEDVDEDWDWVDDNDAEFDTDFEDDYDDIYEENYGYDVDEDDDDEDDEYDENDLGICVVKPS